MVAEKNQVIGDDQAGFSNKFSIQIVEQGQSKKGLKFQEFTKITRIIKSRIIKT